MKWSRRWKTEYHWDRTPVSRHGLKSWWKQKPFRKYFSVIIAVTELNNKHPEAQESLTIPLPSQPLPSRTRYLPMCRVLNVDVGDNVAPSVSVLCRPDDFSDASVSSHCFHTIHEFHTLPSSCSCTVYHTKQTVFF